jgi:hypothetical protein
MQNAQFFYYTITGFEGRQVSPAWADPLNTRAKEVAALAGYRRLTPTLLAVRHWFHTLTLICYGLTHAGEVVVACVNMWNNRTLPFIGEQQKTRSVA